MWALTGLEDGHRGSPAGWQSSAGLAAPSRYRGGRGRSQSWLNPSVDLEPLGWSCQACGMDATWEKTSGCGRTGQRRLTETETASLVVLMLFFCCSPVAVWCRCNICCTSSRLCGESSLLWCILCEDWSWGQWTSDKTTGILKDQYASGNNKTHITEIQSSSFSFHTDKCAPKNAKGFLTWQLLFDKRQHCKVNLAVCNDDLPLESVHCSHPRPLRVHLPTQIPHT